MSARPLLFAPAVGTCLLLAACEQVIDVELNDAEASLVIEALLDGADNTLTVATSLTGPYFDETSTTPVRPEVVEVVFPNGSVEPLTEAVARPGQPAPDTGRAGQYILRRRDPYPLGDYTARVLYDGLTYAATATLRAPIAIRELVTAFEPETIQNDEGYSIELRYDDPPGETNYYRIDHDVNGERQREPDDFIVIDDQLSDGVLARTPIFEQVFDVGDTVSVRLRHLDAGGYAYYRTLAETVGGGRGPGGAAPGNPLTNWTPATLGAFVAWTESEATVMIDDAE